MATEGQIADYSQAQKFITSQARQDLTVLWREAQQLPVEQARRFLKEGVQALVDRYGLMTASVAADFFEALTGETAVVPESYSPAQIQASTNWALQPPSGEETAEALRGDGLERLSSVTVRLVLQYGRNTIDTSVASTPGVLYARKIMGETCDFCLLLASRGPVYGDAQKAGGDGNSYHNDCDCVPVPCKGEWVAGQWEGDDPGYDYRRLYAEEYAPYHRRGDSIQQTLARKRRILEASQPAEKRGRPRKQQDDSSGSDWPEFAHGEALEQLGVGRREVTLLERELSEEDIIERIGGGDKTYGSCMSVAYAYVANRAGYDVLDFRGGACTKYFAEDGNAIRLQASGTHLPGTNVNDINGFRGAYTLLETCEEGKRYLLCCGEHASIVRRTGKKDFEYLELQSHVANGWHRLNRYELRRRFKVQQYKRFYGMTLEQTAYIVDVDVLAKAEQFQALLPYINTASERQRKGAGGVAK